MKGGLRLLSQELAVLGLDLQSTLHEEPRFLLDPTFLGSLHLELHERLEPEDARAALLQLGFLHGLRDALVVMEGSLGGSVDGPAASPAAARVAMQLTHGIDNAGLDIQGAWPDHREADAIRQIVGEKDTSMCHLSSGYTAGWLSGVFDADIVALETECRCKGNDVCRFIARESSAWIAEGERSALELLEALPVRPLRDIVEHHMAKQPPTEESVDHFERGSAVVHVWGPVMVVPFSGPDEALRALDLIGRDPGARDVRVVVLDLAGAIIDDGFGASALEQVLDAVASWGAEPILTGISPLSEAAVADVERSHLLMRKDLPEAIATAFQMAEALRTVS